MSSTFLKQSLCVFKRAQEACFVCGFLLRLGCVCIAVGLSSAQSSVFLAANFHLVLRGCSQAMLCTPVLGNEENLPACTTAVMLKPVSQQCY